MHECEKTDDITRIMIDVACIKQSLLGNGEKGLCKRVEDLENNYSNGIKVFSAIGLAIGSLVTFLMGVFKS